MCLHVDLDAAFLVLPKAMIMGAEIFYFSNKYPDSAKQPDPKPNSNILTKCVTLAVEA